jgi:quinoprotein glucose dehydrogenase
VLALAALAGCDQPPGSGAASNDQTVAGWPSYGGDEGGTHFSRAAQITPANVKQLRVAWTYRSGDNDPATFPDKINHAAFEATPILAQNTLYLCSPRNRVIALDAETGAERWHFDAKPDTAGVYMMTCRGVAYYRDSNAAAGAACAARIFAGTVDGRLLALDASTGAPCADFGSNGQIDLKADLGPVKPADYVLTSPPLVVGDRVITGAQVGDLVRADMPGGVIRAFDAHSGALSWAWDPVPPDWPRDDAPPASLDAQPAAPQRAKYTRSTPNAWAPLAADTQRKLVFIPTGNPANDYYAGDRHGLDYYGSSIVALDSDSGKVVWHFQTVHHDIWDYDLPAQPLLFDFPGADGPIPALVQTTKTGMLFVLNRETGKPLFPIDELPVPTGGVTPELVSPTQPFPRLPIALHPQRLTEDDIWGFTWFDRHACLREFRKLRNDGLFTPVSTQPTLQYPGFMGGSSWGGVAWDPVRKILIANTTRVPAVVQLIPRAEAEKSKEPLEQQAGSPYAFKRVPLLSPLGAPCNRPPWGVLTAIDMRTGRHRWEVPLGTTRDQAPFPIWLNLGVPNTGGALVTASGLTFIGAATDTYLRAFLTETGEEIWKARLPAGGQATPMTYRLRPDGNQFVVIAAGGHAHLGTKLGDYVVAYTLP